MRVIVTGGAGFIGSNYAKQLLLNTDSEIKKVTVLDKLTYAGSLSNLDGLHKLPKFNFVHGDICDQNLVSEVLKGHDTVINFAAESHVDNSITNANPFILSNVLGVQTLLDASLKNGIKKFIQISTDEVYGSIMQGEASEEALLNPSSPYSASKASAELIALSYFHTHGLDVRVTRSSNNYGPRQHREKLIPLFVQNLINDKQVPLYGDGLNVRNWIHVDDHCRGISAVLEKGKPGSIYNLGGKFSISNLELTQKMLTHFNKGQEFIKWTQDRKGHDFRYAISTRKAQVELGFNEEMDFKSEFQATLNWYTQNFTK
jgi:dTDP-glucose 4,6-dehydratase